MDDSTHTNEQTSNESFANVMVSQNPHSKYIHSTILAVQRTQIQRITKKFASDSKHKIEQIERIIRERNDFQKSVLLVFSWYYFRRVKNKM